MNFDSSRIIDSNGTKYRTGWDEHGWFSIQIVEENPYHDEEPDSGPKWLPAEDRDGNAYPITSFAPENVEDLKEAIEDR